MLGAGIETGSPFKFPSQSHLPPGSLFPTPYSVLPTSYSPFPFLIILLLIIFALDNTVLYIVSCGHDKQKGEI